MTKAITIRLSQSKLINVIDSNILARGGRRLIAAARDWTRSRGIRDLEVSAWSFNLETIAFYKRAGFEPTWARFAMAVE